MFLEESSGPWLNHGISLETSSSEEDISCTEGSVWYKECNKCRCEGGMGFCTEKACNGDSSDLDGTCEENSSWKVDCNWCDCFEGSARCTQIYCPGFIGGLHDSFLIFYLFFSI